MSLFADEVEEEQSVTKPLPSPTGWGTMRVVRVSELVFY